MMTPCDLRCFWQRNMIDTPVFGFDNRLKEALLTFFFLLILIKLVLMLLPLVKFVRVLIIFQNLEKSRAQPLALLLHHTVRIWTRVLWVKLETVQLGQLVEHGVWVLVLYHRLAHLLTLLLVLLQLLFPVLFSRLVGRVHVLAAFGRRRLPIAPHLSVKFSLAFIFR